MKEILRNDVKQSLDKIYLLLEQRMVALEKLQFSKHFEP